MQRPLLACAAITMTLALGAEIHGQRRAAASRQAPAASPAPRPSAAPLIPAGARSPRNASYSIDAELDPAARVITGRQVLTWRNITSHPTSELQFHLYWNAWRNTSSTWMRERERSSRPPGARRGDSPADRPEGDWSAIDVTAIRLLAGGSSPMADLTRASRFIAPDDGNAEDRTVLSVPLPGPIAPGDTATVELAWTAHVPRTFARTGAVDSYFFIAQWFPKVGVLEEDGWSTHQFHAGTEFYSDYGVYDVRLTVPRGWVVGATGREQERTDAANNRTTHRYVEEDVHDFAWTTSPDFEESTERFEHAGLPPVTMRLLSQPEHRGQRARHFAATRAALRYYGEWFGPYPYGHITIVDPAWQSSTGGMEYPTLFTAGTNWLAPRHTADPEDVTVHECGHQFWYGIVGSNEFEHAWLDEGLNQFSTERVMEQVFAPVYFSERFFGGVVPWVFEGVPMSRRDGEGAGAYGRVASREVPATPSFRYLPENGGPITYYKTALWLHTLERLIGWRRLQRGMSLYFTRWAFRHPKPEDFFAAINEAAGRDLTWYFDQVYRSSNTFDYGIDMLRSEPVAVRGFVERNGRRVFSDGSPEPAAHHHTEVIVRRHGSAYFPVEVLVRFDDGSVVRERWDGRDRWKLYTYDRKAAAVSAEVDPDQVLLLDVNRTNNGKALAPATAEASRQWAARWWLWMQDMVLTYGFFV